MRFVPKPGDRVIVRSWEDMADEYGTTSTGSIDCLHRFVYGMRPFCGGVATVESVRMERRRIDLDFDDPELNDLRCNYAFSTDMIEPYSDAEETEETTVSDTQELLWLYGVNN